MKTAETIRKKIINTRAGDILRDINRISLKDEMYLVAGVSHCEAALVRLFEKEDMNDLLLRICFPFKCRLPFGEGNSNEVLYADLSKIIFKDTAQLSSLLGRHPEKRLCTVSKPVINEVVKILGDMSTISNDIKSRFFQAAEPLRRRRRI